MFLLQVAYFYCFVADGIKRIGIINNRQGNIKLLGINIVTQQGHVLFGTATLQRRR